MNGLLEASKVGSQVRVKATMVGCLGNPRRTKGRRRRPSSQLRLKTKEDGVFYSIPMTMKQIRGHCRPNSGDDPAEIRKRN